MKGSDMKDLLAGLLALIESKSIPAAYKSLLGAAVLAVLLRLAGFPVVSYVETVARELFTMAPSIGYLAVGILFGSLMGQPFRAFGIALTKMGVKAFDLNAGERKFISRICWFVAFAVFIGLVLSALCMVIETLGML